MSIRIKAFIAPSVLLVCLTLVCVQSWFALTVTNEGIERLSLIELPKRATIEKFAGALGDAHVLLFRYVSWLGQGIDKANLEKLRGEIAAQNRRVDAASAELASRRDLTRDEKEVSNKARETVAGYVDQTTSIIAMGADDASMATMLLSQADDTMHQMRSNVDRLSSLNGELSAKIARDLAGESRAREQFLIGTAVVASIIGLLVAWNVTMSLVRPLRAIAAVVRGLVDGRSLAIEEAYCARRDEIGEMAKAMAVFQKTMAENARLESAEADRRERADKERGLEEERRREAVESERSIVARSIGFALKRLAAMDLRYRMKEAIPEAYSALRDNFNSAIEQLDRALQSVDGSAREIRSGSETIAQAARDLSSRTEQQAASLQDTAGELDAITANVKKSAMGASRARAVVSAADDDAKKSALVVNRAVLAMDAIEKSSVQIGQIIGVIDEIAFQTSLLALNAGVEAARAGEMGRGFAIVAAEVRTLAQRSAEAAKQIKGLVTASSRQVETGVSLVAETGASLERIMAKVAEINIVVAEIAEASHEQATGLEHVNASVAEMDHTTQRNAAMAEQSTAASQTLSQETRQLESLIGRFELGAADAGAPFALRRAG